MEKLTLIIRSMNGLGTLTLVWASRMKIRDRRRGRNFMSQVQLEVESICYQIQSENRSENRAKIETNLPTRSENGRMNSIPMENEEERDEWVENIRIVFVNEAVYVFSCVNKLILSTSNSLYLKKFYPMEAEIEWSRSSKKFCLNSALHFRAIIMRLSEGY